MSNSYKPKYKDFKKAIPVWAKNRENEMNLWLSFRSILNSNNAILRITGSSAYSIYIDGQFIAFGPARSAHDFFRVDEIDIGGYLKDNSVLVIDVAGYNINSFYHIDQPSFICAEIETNGNIICATGHDGFICREMTEHIQKVHRFSYQRVFCEAYDLDTSILEWYSNQNIIYANYKLINVSKTNDKTYIERGCYLNTYDKVSINKLYAYQKFTIGDHKDDLRYPRQVKLVNGPDVIYKGYELNEVSIDSLLIPRNIDITDTKLVNEKIDKIHLNQYEAVMLECDTETTGKLSFDIEVEEDCELVVVFDEILTNDGVLNYRKNGNIQSLIWRLKVGEYKLSSFEPYSYKFLRFCITKGKANITNPQVIYFGADKISKKYIGGDFEVNEIYNAAIETYRQNTFTIFMDCPSRERAGWLCDSFFTARSEKVLTNSSQIEHNFLENFFLPDKFKCLPEGMFPECYPADHYGGGYISNWAMFLVIELEEYLKRTNDIDFINSAKDRIYKLLSFFEKYENKDGLLEKLQKWVFVEWSKCNELTQDISYPTNMLYYKMLKSVEKLYNDSDAGAKANKIKKAINEQSITSDGFYCDNAIYDENGILKLSNEVTETCQYYAFFCDIATPNTNPVLWERMVNDFGPYRIESGNWPNLSNDAKWKNVYASNAFIGNYLRLELLYRYGQHSMLLDNIKGYFYKMASATGTLWENDLPSASTNHGFASHIVYWLDGLGLLS